MYNISLYSLIYHENAWNQTDFCWDVIGQHWIITSEYLSKLENIELYIKYYTFINSKILPFEIWAVQRFPEFRAALNYSLYVSWSKELVIHVLKKYIFETAQHL